MKRFTAGLCFLFFLAVLLLPVLLSQRSSASDLLEGGSEPRSEKIIRILVFGKDRSAGLTDAIFLLSADPAAGRASILQIPRDTYAEYTAKDYRKLNGALRALGLEDTCCFLEHALGIPIDAGIVLELDTVRRMVDAIGGVDVELAQELRYSDPAQKLEIRLPKGPNHLDGEKAEQFLRFRSGYANADLGRLDAQKEFLRAFFGAVRPLSATERLRLLLLCAGHVETDLTVGQMLRLGDVMQAISEENITMQTLPGAAVRGSSGAWYYSLSRERAIRALSEATFLDVNELRAAFDPDGVFDRTEHSEFHKIYTAPVS